MKRLIFSFASLMLLFIGATNGQTKRLALSFVFKQEQSDFGSGQYAVWIEDNKGKIVRTLHVTRFTAEGGHIIRPESLPEWVKKANPKTLSEKQIDAFSGATPADGTQSYTWDGRDDLGQVVPNGEYLLFVEGTLYWTSEVIYSAPIQLGGAPQTTIPIKTQYVNKGKNNTNMLTEVKVSYK